MKSVKREFIYRPIENDDSGGNPNGHSYDINDRKDPVAKKVSYGRFK